MKPFIISSLTLFLFFSISVGCRKEKKLPPADCCCGYVHNSIDSSKCECKLPTHVEIPGGGGCLKYTKLTYKVRMSARNCLPGIGPEFYSLDSVGIMQFHLDGNQWFHIIMSHPGQLNLSSEIRRLKMTEHADGRFEFDCMLWPLVTTECLDWRQRSVGILAYAELYGISNVPNTEMTIKVLYKDYANHAVLDTGYLYLTKL